MVGEGVILDQCLREKYSRTPNSNIVTRLEGAKYWIERGHHFYRKENFRRALHFYDKALRYLKNIQIEKPFLKDLGKYQDEALELIRTAWIWMGIAHQEMGAKEKSYRCFQTERLYAEKHLALFKKRKKLKNKKILKIKLFIATWLLILIGLFIATRFLGSEISFIIFLFTFYLPLFTLAMIIHYRNHNKKQPTELEFFT